MSRLQYQCSMSLDGFIAGAGGDMSWLTPYMTAAEPASDSGSADPDATFRADLADAVGAVLMGSRTFRGDDPNKGTDSEGAYGGQWSGPTFVLTHDLPAEPVAGDVSFVNDLHAAVAAATEAAGDRIVGVFGADVARQCVEANLLDEILVSIVPILLGDGVRLFDRPGRPPVPLDVLEVSGLTIRLRLPR
ncbi:dihydrofolate reductase [Actinoalloteichus hoggarensis]|uniref:Uncharacterized protein n=1 Tax=Actinoalloteichus hoggarensis TaxID=1470176 RepID=A0A221W5G8_9PSEU|nr:dihydrofolate reductase family protein [Actinoalloteichus hoggarensis]ASO20757.1 hypothetical protein AHOG_15655 [Actinoalloteichus hoggarensis]MBB5920687.1 dihydrofolate reductase [Actinoalloteichus hoggarensis]